MIKKYLYHITHMDNLDSIIAARGLWSDFHRVKYLKNVVEIGYQDIKQRRLKKTVPVSAQGFLGEYVPFYFAPRSPMLYTITHGNTSFAGKQNEIIYIVTSVERAIETGRPYCFTDGHAEMGIAAYETDIAKLGTHVDWKVMEDTYWANTDADPTRKFRRQAEFLVHEFFPWSHFLGVATMNSKIKSAVLEKLSNAQGTHTVKVKSEWYYMRNERSS